MERKANAVSGRQANHRAMSQAFTPQETSRGLQLLVPPREFESLSLP